MTLKVIFAVWNLSNYYILINMACIIDYMFIHLMQVFSSNVIFRTAVQQLTISTDIVRRAVSLR